MRERFYKWLTACSRRLGPGFFTLIAQGIAAGYFFLFPNRTLASVRFYQALYPDRTRFYHYWCAWCQFRSFTSVFLDRFLLSSGGLIRNTFEGRHYLRQAIEEKRGGILLMSHLGNWEVGARLLRRAMPELRLMLYVGQRIKDQIERMQKQDLAASGIRILAVDQEGGSAFDLVEGIAFLRSGGFVSMAGDMIWRPDQRAVKARFLNHWVQLPEAPHMLALIARVPVYVFFASSRGQGRYHFSICPPIDVQAANRADRVDAIRQSVQAYAKLVEDHLRRHPFEWYHFQAFLGEPVEPSKSL